MKTSRQQLGARGEALAAEHLAEKGCKIIAKNYRAGKAEIDLVCRDGESLVFVEVKSVRVSGFGFGEEKISAHKQKMMIAAAYNFLDENRDYEEAGVRFDVVVVNFSSYPAEVVHYPSAFWETN